MLGVDHAAVDPAVALVDRNGSADGRLGVDGHELQRLRGGPDDRCAAGAAERWAFGVGHAGSPSSNSGGCGSFASAVNASMTFPASALDSSFVDWTSRSSTPEMY